MARHTRPGVAGISTWLTPTSASASKIALIHCSQRRRRAALAPGAHTEPVRRSRHLRCFAEGGGEKWQRTGPWHRVVHEARRQQLPTLRLVIAVIDQGQSVHATTHTQWGSQLLVPAQQHKGFCCPLDHSSSRQLEPDRGKGFLHGQIPPPEYLLLAAVLRWCTIVDDATFHHDMDIVGDLFGKPFILLNQKNRHAVVA
jgi:hypothetical protein